MAKSASDSILRFDQVTVQFDEAEALKAFSFDVKPGETRILLGAAGSGKTVLLKTAISLDCPSSGKVFLFGQEIQGLREKELYPLRQKVGVLFQEGALFDSMTIERNVAFPLMTRLKLARSSGNGARSPGGWPRYSHSHQGSSGLRGTRPNAEIVSE